VLHQGQLHRRQAHKLVGIDQAESQVAGRRGGMLAARQGRGGGGGARR
jgi:hypothetical protein